MTEAPLWEWSEAAQKAFLEGANAPPFVRLNVRRGLNAALACDIEAIFSAQVAGMVETLVSHPILRERVLVLKADEDGKTRLKIDKDLIYYILFDKLPDGLTYDEPTKGGTDDE